MPIISARHLVKDFVRSRRQTGPFASLRTLFTRQTTVTHAVSDVSLEIDAGEVVGYLGPNGAGKSTTIKMLSGILVPTSGNVEVCGIVPWEDRTRNAMNIGVVFGQRSQLWWDQPLDDSLAVIAKMYRMEPGVYRRNLGMLTELLELAPFLDTPVRQLSLGQRMRGDLAAAVLYEPPVLFLDEPTVGLDLIAKERIRTFIEQLNAERKTTVLLTTHDLDDVERLCKRLIIIDHGQVVYDGPAASLKRQYAPYRLLDVEIQPDGLDAMAALDLPQGLALESRKDFRANFTVDPDHIAVAEAIAVIARQLPIADLGVREPPLEGIIRQIYEQGRVAT